MINRIANFISKIIVLNIFINILNTFLDKEEKLDTFYQKLNIARITLDVFDELYKENKKVGLI